MHVGQTVTFNGMKGRIRSIDTFQGTAEVQFNHGRVVVPLNQLKRASEPAPACTGDFQ